MTQNVQFFDSVAALSEALHHAQAQRQTRVIFALGRNLAPSSSISHLRTLLDRLLPMVQARSGVVRRERGGCWYVNLSLRYREGVRMADAWRSGDVSALSEAERTALGKAQQLVQPCLFLPEAERAKRLMETAQGLAVYDNPPRGRADCAAVLGAASMMQSGRANCQGYSDLFYLLASMAGLTATYRSGWKLREAHLWNELWLHDAWVIVDVTSGWFGLSEKEARSKGLSWEANELFNPAGSP